MEKHLNKESGDCKKQPVECPYKCIGCDKVKKSIVFLLLFSLIR